jgi:hypothetical protein
MLIPARWARIAAAGATTLAALSLSGVAGAAAPDNDDFANAEPLSGRSAFVSQSNVDATKEQGEPDHAGEAGGASIWFTWTAPAAGRTTLSTCSSDVETVLAVYTGAAVDNLVEVAAIDGCTAHTEVFFQAAAGTQYRIAVDGVGGDSGLIDLELNLAPPNDDFAAARTITGDTGSVGGTTEGASLEADEPDHSFGDGFPSVWFKWTAPSTGWATFASCDSESIVAAYVGSTLAGLSEVANDDGSCWPGSRIAFEATVGTTYSVAVAGAYGSEGDFTLTWNRNPPPPEPPYAIDVPGISGVPVEGQTLTAVEGAWGGAAPIAFAYAWGRCNREGERCDLIDGARGRTYVPASGDIGWRLFVRVIATNAVGSAEEESGYTALVAARAPLNRVVPFVSGLARPGQILVATSGEWNGTAPISMAYRWQSCYGAVECIDLPGEAGPVIRVSSIHLARSLRVVVTATNAGGSATAASDTTAVVRLPAVRRCVVPNVKRKTAVAARRAIRRAGCTTGRIRRSYSASVGSGRVVSQSPRPGARRAASARVDLVLSKGKKR